MSGTWEVTVVVEFPALPEDSAVKYLGDAEIDFAYRAFHARLAPALETLRAALPGSHWTIKALDSGAMARRCA